MSNTVTNDKMKLGSPSRSIFAYYEDADEQAIIMQSYGEHERVEISAESGAAIKTAMFTDDMVESSEGYDDNPSAFIYWPYPSNEYVNLLTQAERKAVAAALWGLKVRFYGSEERALNPGGGRVVNGRLGRPRSW